jgi:hypothetical protein
MYLVDYDVIMLDNHQVQVEEMYLPHKQMDEFDEREIEIKVILVDQNYLMLIYVIS